jgi:hypothetical protein
MPDKLDIKVNNNGRMNVSHPDGGAFQAGGAQPPGITLPPGLPPNARVLDACIVISTNPTCAWCLVGGGWQVKCW